LDHPVDTTTVKTMVRAGVVYDPIAGSMLNKNLFKLNGSYRVRDLLIVNILNFWRRRKTKNTAKLLRRTLNKCYTQKLY